MYKLHLQTDRPKTEFWNSGNVELSRDLAAEFGITAVQITYQSCYGKVDLIAK